jgi:hypothetical protein
MSRLATLVGVLAVALLAVPGAASFATSTSPGCPAAGAKTIARDGSVRVYRVGPEGPVVACRMGHSGHMTLLAKPAPCCHGLRGSVGSFQLAGPIVGYIETQFGVDSGSSKLILVDVASRRVLRSIDGGSYVDAGLILSERIASFALDSHGSLAWVASRSEHRQPAQLSVHDAAPHRPPATLDEGPSIDPHSLRLSNGRLSWSNAGVTRTVSIP